MKKSDDMAKVLYETCVDCDVARSDVEKSILFKEFLCRECDVKRALQRLAEMYEELDKNQNQQNHTVTWTNDTAPIEIPDEFTIYTDGTEKKST